MEGVKGETALEVENLSEGNRFHVWSIPLLFMMSIEDTKLGFFERQPKSATFWHHYVEPLRIGNLILENPYTSVPYTDQNSYFHDPTIPLLFTMSSRVEPFDIATKCDIS